MVEPVAEKRSRLRVVVIDDDQDSLNVTAAYLRRAGHEVTATTRGAEGVNTVLASGSVDVLVTDVVMPEFDGIEVIRALRTKRPDLWIVAISGGGPRLTPDMTLHYSRKLGANRVLHKPFTKEDLLAALDRSAKPKS